MVTTPQDFDEKDLLGYADPTQYIGLDDRLLITALSNTAAVILTVNYRILTVQGKLQPGQFTVNLGSARALTSFAFQLAQGFLVSLEIFASTGAADGVWTYAKADLTRGGGSTPLPYQPLFAGYVDVTFAFGYPKQKYQRPTDGAGLAVSYTVTNPAAGADWVFTCPSGTRQRLISLVATLSTSMVAGDRQPQFAVTDGTDAIYELFASGTVPASSSTTYTFAPISFYGGSVATGFIVPSPIGLILEPGWLLGVETNNLDVGDQWAGITVAMQEWAEMK